LDQINRSNVQDLAVAFSVSLAQAVAVDASEGLQVTPLVDAGQMFLNHGYGDVYRIDVTEGDRGVILWRTDIGVDEEAEIGFVWNRTRGPALWANNVYVNTIDGRVVAVNQDNGEVVWDTQVARTTLGYENLPGGPDAAHFVAGEGFTAAPLAVEGLILVGQSKGDWATRGWLAAMNADTGEEVWRTYTIPAPGEPGHETWADDHNAWRTGGGSLWTTGSYDPAQRLTIWGTANPAPMYDPFFRPGDNLYTNSAIAFDIDTGDIVWYFQYVPNEYFDYDEQGVHMLYDAEINGEMRSLVGHFGRNGFFYQLDRQSGEFVNATQYIHELNWTAGIDEKTGLPLEYDPNQLLQVYAFRPEPNGQRLLKCPGTGGGLRWQPPAFNPESHIIYAAGLESCGAAGIGQVTPFGPAVGNH
jgi:alcohol dehydrogenase (cytochrome c)